MKHALSHTLIALCVLAAPAFAESDESPALSTWGKLSPVRKTEFFELKYVVRKPNGKAKKQKAFVKIDADARFFVDRRVSLDALEVGADVYLFGEPVERTSTNEDGRKSVDRQVLSTRAIVAGEGLEVPDESFKLPGVEATWFRATVSMSGNSGLYVRYEGSEYKVICARKYGVILRQPLETAPKLKKKVWAEVTGERSEERPAKAKAKDQVFALKRVVILAPELRGLVYPLLIP